jgi:hypothetical protein
VATFLIIFFFAHVYASIYGLYPPPRLHKEDDFSSNGSGRQGWSALAWPAYGNTIWNKNSGMTKVVGSEPIRLSKQAGIPTTTDDQAALGGTSNVAGAKLVEKCPSELAWTARIAPSLNTTFEVADDIVHDPTGPRPDQIVLLTATDGGGHNGGVEDIFAMTTANRKAYCNYHGYKQHFVNVSKYDLDGAAPNWGKIPAIIETFNTFPDAQWIWMLDLDVIIMTPMIDLRTLLLSQTGLQSALDLNAPLHGKDWESFGLWTSARVEFTKTDLLISQDHNGLNSGSFFIRRSQFSRFLLDVWADPFFMKLNLEQTDQNGLVSLSPLQVSFNCFFPLALSYVALYKGSIFSKSTNLYFFPLQIHLVKHHSFLRSHVGIIKQRVANAYSEGPDDMRWSEGDLVVHFAGCWVGDQCTERWNSFWPRRNQLPSAEPSESPGKDDKPSDIPQRQPEDISDTE